MSPHILLFPQASFGRSDQLYTAAYWEELAKEEASSFPRSTSHRLGSSFREECVACLLGGYGIPAEVGLEAFAAIRRSGLLQASAPTRQEVFRVLGAPLALADGRRVKYRFAQQKSAYLAHLLGCDLTPPQTDHHRTIRNWLMGFPGFGPKTASWVVRNWYDSDQVAVIDVHLFRAGIMAGFFEPTDQLPRDYSLMERRFLAFAAFLGVRPSNLDALIWRQLKRDGKLVFSCLRHRAAA